MVDDPLAAHLAAHYELGFETARAVESEPTLSGLSAHLLAVGTKPGAVQPG